MATKRNWFSVKAARGNNAPEVLIYDEIGAFGVSAKDFKDELDTLGDVEAFDLRINSPGGNVFVGNAIYNMLADMVKAGVEITVYVDGVAASMASLIAMVGTSVVMPANAMMMIHNPAGVAIGGSKDMRRMGSLLDTLKEGMVTAYVAKSGLSREEVVAIMDEETWFTAEEAVEAGFADLVGATVNVAAKFDLSKFKHPPKALAKGTNRGKAAQQKEEISDMEKSEVEAMIQAANKPILDALAKLTPADPKATDKAADTESPADMEKRIKAEAKAYRDEVRSLCALAGMPDKAEAFIDEETPVADVRKALADEQAKGGKTAPKGKTATATAPNNHRSSEEPGAADDDHSDLVVESLNTREIWGDWNKAGKQGQRRAA